MAYYCDKIIFTKNNHGARAKRTWKTVEEKGCLIICVILLLRARLKDCIVVSYIKTVGVIKSVR